eukprot:4138099-Pleurochrysis_carterae.AAC.1
MTIVCPTTAAECLRRDGHSCTRVGARGYALVSVGGRWWALVGVGGRWWALVGVGARGCAWLRLVACGCERVAALGVADTPTHDYLPVDEPGERKRSGKIQGGR